LPHDGHHATIIHTLFSPPRFTRIVFVADTITEILADPKATKFLTKLSYNCVEAAEATGVTLGAVRDAVSRRILPSKKIGRKRIIARADLERWVGS
jgi:excisionase family DNA binding protein